MRCAALHRKLGTHITKVKSLSMDSWSNEQVDVWIEALQSDGIDSNIWQNMKKVGNVVSNRIYNPQNTRPPIPFDADEADSAMERFIRQKYQDRAVKAPTRHNTGSTNSDDQPPPLPPKEGRRFGFRSASSIFPLSSKSRRETAARQEFETSQQDDFDAFGERSPSHRMNKQSRIFGNNVGATYDDDLDVKMAKLRDMGFMDEKRNIAVLKGLSGNLEKSIETLARLGEGNGVPRMPPKPKPTVDTSGPSSRSRTPLSPSAGLTIDRTPHKEPTRQTSNPFDMLDTPPPIAQPQSSQSTGSLPPPPNQNPYQQTSNPFGLMPSQSQVGLNQAFQSMAVSSPQPPLFPNHTGGFPGPQQQPNQQMYQQSMTPPVPSIPQQYYPPIYENVQQQPQQPQQAQQVEQSINYNPFMQQQTQTQTHQAPPINTNFQSNPFMQQMQPQGQNLYQSPTEQQSPQQYRSPAAFHSYQNQTQPQSNPFLQNSQAQQPYDYQQQNQQQNQFQQPPRQQTFPLMAQQNGRADSRTILDLYNYPQAAPTPQQPQQTQQDQMQAQNMAMPSTATYQQQPQLQPRSVSSPLVTQIAGNRNPFMSNGGGVHSSAGDSVGNMNPFPQVQNGARHASQESVNIDAGGWQNGRHSPDAWGTISARSTR